MGKRRPKITTPPPTAYTAHDLDHPARQLVTRGLASSAILESPRTPRKERTPYVVTTPLPRRPSRDH